MVPLSFTRPGARIRWFSLSFTQPRGTDPMVLPEFHSAPEHGSDGSP